MTNDEQAIQCAIEQVSLDIPYVDVTDAFLYRRIVNEDGKLVPGNTQATGDRWYVEVELQHAENRSLASALYRVWRTPEGLRAIKVAIA